MVRVYDSDLNTALKVLDRKSRPDLEIYKSQMYFRPDRNKPKKRPMKKKQDKRPGGRFRGGANGF